MTATLRRHSVPVDDILARADMLPGQRDTPTRSERRALLRFIGDLMNTWEGDFLHATWSIARALVDGRLTETILAAYPADHTYPEHLSRAIASQAGMVFTGDPVSDPDVHVVDREAVGIAVEALRGLTVGDVGIHEGVWSAYEEMFDATLTIDRAGQLMRHYAGGGLAAAARLIAAAWEDRL